MKVNRAHNCMLINILGCYASKVALCRYLRLNFVKDSCDDNSLECNDSAVALDIAMQACQNKQFDKGMSLACEFIKKL